MGIKGIIFMMVALIGFLINFFAKPVAEKCFHREIRDDETWKFYNQNNIIDIENTQQEIKNLKTRNNAMQCEIDNLQNENEHIKIEYKNYKEYIHSRTSYKIYKKFKRLTGGKNG